jgi:type I restriction enzyme R subunit
MRTKTIVPIATFKTLFRELIPWSFLCGLLLRCGVRRRRPPVVTAAELIQGLVFHVVIPAANPTAKDSARRAAEEEHLGKLAIIERAHPDLGRLGVFWHTQGSGKSYSMVMFAEKVRRHIRGNFTFVIATDREDLDDQIFRTFVGCGIADEKTPRARSGRELKALLQQNHRFVFCLIHKFNQDVDPNEPYSTRDDIIVISDEAHRTQAGKFASECQT